MSDKYNSEAKRTVDEIRTLGNNMEGRAGAVALGIQDAQNEVARMKSSIERGISLLQTRVNELSGIYQGMVSESSQATGQINMLETQVNTNQKIVKEAETLASIRKEQADELRRKGEGNYHSSWLGLWRPLSEQSRVGLLVSAIFFGLLAIALLVLYGKQFLPGAVLAYFGASSFGYNKESLNFAAIAGSQMGGKRRKE
jgi:hypothetical protein